MVYVAIASATLRVSHLASCELLRHAVDWRRPHIVWEWRKTKGLFDSGGASFVRSVVV